MAYRRSVVRAYQKMLAYQSQYLENELIRGLVWARRDSEGIDSRVENE